MADFVTATEDRSNSPAKEPRWVLSEWARKNYGLRRLRNILKGRKEESINFVVRLTVPVAIVLFSI